MFKLENESVVALPERLETSDYNFSYFSASQGNFALQAARGSAVQGAGQSNWAGAIVTQVNL